MKTQRLVFIILGLGLNLPTLTAQDTDPTQITQSWVMEHVRDELHNMEFDRFTLSGRYLTAPHGYIGQNETPTLNIFCTKEKVFSSSLVVGGLVKSFGRRLGGWTTDLYIRIDDSKKPSSLSSLYLSSDARRIELYSSHLAILLSGKRLLVGTFELVGGEIQMQFDIPDIAALASSCGKDGNLRGLFAPAVTKTKLK